MRYRQPAQRALRILRVWPIDPLTINKLRFRAISAACPVKRQPLPSKSQISLRHAQLPLRDLVAKGHRLVYAANHVGAVLRAETFVPPKSSLISSSRCLMPSRYLTVPSSAKMNARPCWSYCGAVENFCFGFSAP